MKLVTDKLGLAKASSCSMSSNKHLQKQSIKTTSFFSTMQSTKSENTQSLYLTMEDLDQQSIRNFRLSSKFVAGLLTVNLLCMVLTFTFQRSLLVEESLPCKACNISLTYTLFFLTSAYLALTLRNLKIFTGPKDFKNVLFVRSKKSVVILFICISGLACLLGQTTSVLCHDVVFPVYILCMVVLMSQTLILLANFKIANEIRKDCEFSIAMESEESGSVSAKNAQGQPIRNQEKFEGSFCIYQSSTREKRKKWQKRRNARRTRRTVQDYKEFDGKSLRISNKKSQMVSNKDIFENEPKKEKVEIQNRRRRSRRHGPERHSIRGIRISFQPKTHSQDSISTQTSESPNQSQNSGLREFSPQKPKNAGADTSGQIKPPEKDTSIGKIQSPSKKNTHGFEFGSNSKILSKMSSQNGVELENESASESCDSIVDLEEFELGIDDQFHGTGRNGLSFYKTPTKRLDEQFRKVCISDKKIRANW